MSRGEQRAPGKRAEWVGLLLVLASFWVVLAAWPLLSPPWVLLAAFMGAALATVGLVVYLWGSGQRGRRRP